MGMVILHIVGYVFIGYVLSIGYERHRRKSLANCHECNRAKNNYYTVNRCTSTHRDPDNMWFVIPFWPVFVLGWVILLIGKFFVAISPSKAADRIDAAAERAAELAEERRVAAEVKRKERAEEAARRARGLVLVEGKDEVDS